MCGIVGSIAERNVIPILLEGLKRLEYRGYDSAGLAILDHQGSLQRVRMVGKVDNLKTEIQKTPNKQGAIGIAHTRWATHGVPNEQNAHPHMGGHRVVLVHNGIIENYAELKVVLQKAGARFESDTDSEVMAVCIEHAFRQPEVTSLREAVQFAVRQIKGAFAICVMDVEDPTRLVAVRSGSPLVLGIGVGEHFVASDALALQPVSNQFVYLEDGDIAEVSKEGFQVWHGEGIAGANAGKLADRAIQRSQWQFDASDKGKYRHFMQKEIHEQPWALRATLESACVNGQIPYAIFGDKAESLLPKVKQMHLVACGTSYHAALVAKFWIETYTNIACQVEIASEFRYRRAVVPPDTLLVAISQSGETADTLAAVKNAKQNPNYLAVLGICNVPGSALTRLCDMLFLTLAGPEIGVCSTKAFTTQLLALFSLTLRLMDSNGPHGEHKSLVPGLVKELQALPTLLEKFLAKEDDIHAIAKTLVQKHSVLFLGRGPCFPIALEGALKLKEISYIHAEAYPGGELKHGPLALIDKDMPVVVFAAQDALWEKLKSNMEEIRAREGEVFLLVDEALSTKGLPNVTVLALPHVSSALAPIAYGVPLQLLAYHVAVLKGTDVDQPRNLAKSVTVE